MKKKWILIGIAVIAALALLAGCVLYINHMKNRPGANLFDGKLYVDLQGTGFTFDVDSGELMGQTPVHADGSAGVGESFDGTLSILGYPITETGTISHPTTLIDAGDGFYEIHYSPTCLHTNTIEETDAEGEVTNSRIEQENHLCNYQYIYVVYPENPDFLAVYVYDEAEACYYCSVVADSEEDAKALYQWLRENKI